MASRVLFERKWKIVLQTMDDTSGNLVPIKTKTIRDLKVTFTIKNTLLGDPSLASFQIYNINEETEALITAYNCYITFYSGYGDENEESWNVLFQGKITNSYDIRQKQDMVWNIWARNAFSLLTTTKPTIKSIQNPTTPKKILESLVDNAIGLAGKPTYVNNCDIKFSSVAPLPEFILEGTFKDEFDDLLLPYGLGWQIQNDEFIVFDQEFTDPSSIEGEAITVSRETGLLSIPMVDYKGVNFSSILNGQFKPTKIIDIAPNTIRYNLGNEFYVEKFDKSQWRAKGKFRIFEVTHRGDTRGDRWDTDVIAFYRRN